jgi:hypothetical protein
VSHPSLVLLTGMDAGATLVVDEILNNFSIGSDQSCNLVCSGVAVSPMHASVFLDDDGLVTISDTNSRMGVFINGHQVMEQALVDGDEISLGPPGDLGSDTLKFNSQTEEVPDHLASSAGRGGLSGFEELEAAPIEEPLFTSEIGRPEFSAPPALPDLPELPSLEAVPAMEASAPPLPAPTPAFLPPLPALPSLDDELPPVRPKTTEVPRPAFVTPPLPPPPPAYEPPPAPAHEPPPPPPDPPPAPEPPPPAPKSSGLIFTPAHEAEAAPPKKSVVIPPPSPAAPILPKAAKKGPASPAEKALRLGVIALALVGVSWFGYRQYAASIVVPVIDKYLPNPAEPGQNVTINGSGFSTDPASVKVMLGDVVLQVLDLNATRINVAIPESLSASGSQTLPLKVVSKNASSTPSLLKITVAPKVVTIAPQMALPGDEITISGKWLTNAKAKPIVAVAGAEAEVLEASPESVRFKMPQVTAASDGQKVAVKVALGSDVGKEVSMRYGRLPFVETISPAKVFPGDVLTVTGLGLALPDITLKVSGRGAAILSRTETELKASVPGLRLSENAGRRDVVLQTKEKATPPLPIEIERESANIYSPRFFAESLDNGRAAVSTELGPVMVLGNDPPSAVRAHETAAKLNALAAKARNTRTEFAAIDATISGPSGPIITLAPTDGSSNLRAIAPLWAAVLTDMFDLFFQSRRPGRTVELSPDGRVFVDIHTAARRHGAGQGISPSLLFPPEPAWARSLAVLATSPSMGAGQANVLLDGFWSGMIEAPGAVPRKIEISLTVTPAGVMGRKTSRQGGLSSDVTLEGVRYSKRELRFSFSDGGDSVNFAGAVDGDEINGTLTRPSGAKVGTLSLKLAR